jgi:serine/threonine protein kinase
VSGNEQEDLSGKTLGPYHVAAKLGQGGMGVVYRARDPRLGREVALKVLPAAVAADSERRARFLREARSAAAVNHPNIAAVYDVGETDGRVYLAMELVEGTTLRGRLASGALPAAEAVRIARAIAAGLARAHERGIVHRDLKPENVMLAPDGAVKILDFGLAKLHEPDSGDAALAQQETQTLEGRVMGTPGDM